MSGLDAIVRRAAELGQVAATTGIDRVLDNLGGLFFASKAPRAVPHQGEIPDRAVTIYGPALERLGLDDPSKTRVNDWVRERLAAYGFNHEAQNYGALRCLLVHDHGSDGRCVACQTTDSRATFLRCYGSDEEALERLLAVARAATLTSPVPSLCSSCRVRDATTHTAGFVDDVRAGWSICSFCRRVGAVVGGEVDGADGGELGALGPEDDIGTLGDVGAAGEDLDAADFATLGAIGDGEVDLSAELDMPILGGYRSIRAHHEVPDPDGLQLDDGLGAVPPFEPAADLLLDVRSAGEFAAEHLEGSIHVPVDDVGARIDEVKQLAGGRRVVVVCAGGLRSARAVHLLREAGVNACNAHEMAQPPTPKVVRKYDPASTLILDVRTPSEYATRHLDGAVNVPVDQVPRRLAELKRLAGGRRIVVFCQGGLRAARAVFFLREAGLDACNGHKECGPGVEASTTRTTVGEVDAEPDEGRAVENKAQELVAAWMTLEPRLDDATLQPDVRFALKSYYDRWRAWWDRWLRGEHGGAEGLGSVVDDTNAAQLALGNVGSVINTLNPLAPSDVAEARVDEVAAVWATLKPKMDANPKVARALKDMYDHWIRFHRKWRVGGVLQYSPIPGTSLLQDTADLNAIISEANAARANAEGKLVQDVPTIKNVALEDETGAKRAAVAVDEAAKTAEDKIKDKTHMSAGKLIAIGAAASVAALAALKIAVKAAL